MGVGPVRGLPGRSLSGAEDEQIVEGLSVPQRSSQLLTRELSPRNVFRGSIGDVRGWRINRDEQRGIVGFARLRGLALGMLDPLGNDRRE